MRVATAAASLSLLLLLPGCWITPSLHPLYSQDRSEVVFEQALLGTWRTSSTEGEAAEAETWTFAAGEDKAYELAILAEGDISNLQAVLVKLGDDLFLDLFPDELTEEQQECVPLYWVMHVIPVHSFARIQLKGDTLSISFLDSEWILAQAKEKKLDIRGEMIDDSAFVLTAPPSAIQALLLKCVADGEAFMDPETLSRVREPTR